MNYLSTRILKREELPRESMVLVVGFLPFTVMDSVLKILVACTDGRTPARSRERLIVKSVLRDGDPALVHL
jgi:hypothetical protein